MSELDIDKSHDTTAIEMPAAISKHKVVEKLIINLRSICSLHWASGAIKPHA